jgi:hypothetical protein
MLGECCNGLDDNGNGFDDEFVCSCTTSIDCEAGDNVCYTAIGTCAPRCNTIGGDSFCTMLGARSCNRRTGECTF